MNSRYFSDKQIEAGELSEFINLLIKQSYGQSKNYSDIHIKPVDIGAVIVEWMDAPWNGEWGGHWQYIDDDDGEVVMKEYIFPDNHYELFETKEEYEETLKAWLEEHEDERWKKDEYGYWYSEKEQEQWCKSLDKDNIKNT